MEKLNETKQKYLLEITVPAEDHAILETVKKRQNYPAKISDNLAKKYDHEYQLLSSYNVKVAPPSPVTLPAAVQPAPTDDLAEKQREILKSLQNTADKFKRLERSSQILGKQTHVDLGSIIKGDFTPISSHNNL